MTIERYFIFMNHIYLPQIHSYALYTYGEADNVCARLLIFKAVHIETGICKKKKLKKKIYSS